MPESDTIENLEKRLQELEEEREKLSEHAAFAGPHGLGSLSLTGGPQSLETSRSSLPSVTDVMKRCQE